jgi:hypothetical protein
VNAITDISEGGATITFCYKIPSYIEVTADWTAGRAIRFTGKSLLLALEAAVAEKKLKTEKTASPAAKVQHDSIALGKRTTKEMWSIGNTVWVKHMAIGDVLEVGHIDAAGHRALVRVTEFGGRHFETWASFGDLLAFTEPASQP